jgi:hypothetical protein
MVDRVLIDTLNRNARDFATRWKNILRKIPHLKHYEGKTDDELVENNMWVYSLLARSLERGIDRSLVGYYFVQLGKRRMEDGFPISEVIYTISICHRCVIEYLMSDFVLDSPARMYQAMGAMEKIAEFFHLGCFYFTKGFLEETYTHMKKRDAVSEELLRKYFRDDFFFKDGKPEGIL